jgi:acyl dehydratase
MATLTDLQSAIGRETFSAWRVITQEMVSAYSALTGDSDPFHDDPEWSRANTPFGGTIVQGFLLLANLTWFTRHPAGEPLEDVEYVMNYGFDWVRFVRPVPVGRPIRARLTLTDVIDRGNRAVLKYTVAIEVEGSPEPHVVAEWLGSAQKKRPAQPPASSST